MIRYKFIKEKDLFIKLDLAFQLLRVNLGAQKIDIENINTIIRSIDVLIKNIIKKHKFSSKKVKILFFELLLNDLQSILVLLEKNWLPRQYKKIKVLEKDTRKSIYLYLKKYDKYLTYLVYKIFSNYGTSILYLLILTLIIWFWFGFLFYISSSYEKLPKAIWVEALQEPNLIAVVIRGLFFFRTYRKIKCNIPLHLLFLLIISVIMLNFSKNKNFLRAIASFGGRKSDYRRKINKSFYFQLNFVNINYLYSFLNYIFLNQALLISLKILLHLLFLNEII